MSGFETGGELIQFVKQLGRVEGARTKLGGRLLGDRRGISPLSGQLEYTLNGILKNPPWAMYNFGIVRW